MTAEMLLYLMVTDLREVSDDDLRDFLEVLLGQPDQNPELMERILDQMEADAPDREAIAGWPEDFVELLPESMAGLNLAIDRFEQILEETLDQAEEEETDRLERFRHCLELLDDAAGWRERSEAARGIASLEEEVYQYRDGYLRQPMRIDQCSPASVVAHRYLLEAFESWHEAFGLAHRGELDDALDAALEGTCLFRTVQSWASLAEPVTTTLAGRGVASRKR